MTNCSLQIYQILVDNAFTARVNIVADCTIIPNILQFLSQSRFKHISSEDKRFAADILKKEPYQITADDLDSPRIDLEFVSTNGLDVRIIDKVKMAPIDMDSVTTNCAAYALGLQTIMNTVPMFNEIDCCIADVDPMVDLHIPGFFYSISTGDDTNDSHMYSYYCPVHENEEYYLLAEAVQDVYAIKFSLKTKTEMHNKLESVYNSIRTISTLLKQKNTTREHIIKNDIPYYDERHKTIGQIYTPSIKAVEYKSDRLGYSTEGLKEYSSALFRWLGHLESINDNIIREWRENAAMSLCRLRKQLYPRHPNADKNWRDDPHELINWFHSIEKNSPWKEYANNMDGDTLTNILQYDLYLQLSDSYKKIYSYKSTEVYENIIKNIR